MLSDNQLLILLFVILGSILLAKAIEIRVNRNVDSQARVLNSIKARLVVFGLLIIGLWFALPSALDFRLLDYPREFASLAEVHAYLTAQGKMLQRLSMIIETFFLIFVLWFLIDLYRIAKSLLAVDRRSPGIQQALGADSP